MRREQPAYGVKWNEMIDGPDGYMLVRRAEAEEKLNGLAAVGRDRHARLELARAEIDLYREKSAAFLGDPQHPDWADYVATNLLDALSLVPDTGDWHGALRTWCERHMTGRLKPNRVPSEKSDG